jgi:UDP-2,3-diacylglucosamine pyrophosphatase LpxH
VKTISPIKRWLAAGLLLLCAGAAQAQSQRVVIAISDLHVGAGKDGAGQWRPIDDFRWESDLSGFLAYASATHGDNIDLVLAGDVFELWQSPTMDCSSDLSAPGCVIKDCDNADRNLGCTEAEAVARLQTVLDKHPEFVAIVRKFATSGENRVFIVPGNHDAALLLPQVGALVEATFQTPRSADGRIYADHGHQFDELNRFKSWPVPYVVSSGANVMRRPWGENMVQQYYDQYEYLFPIIDNLGSDLEGARYGLAHANFLQSTLAVGKLLKFLVLQQSFVQRVDLLGDQHAILTGHVKWNLASVRAKPASFFIEALADDPASMAAANDAVALGASFDASNMSEDEIDKLCRKKALLNESRPAGQKLALCTLADGTLGAFAAGLNKKDPRVAYLRTALAAAASAEHRTLLADLYIYGHTHQADEWKDPLSLGPTVFGVHALKVVNTGAFQRVATLANATAIANGKPTGAATRLSPEDLPACYNYVLVAPYATVPVSKLKRWSRGDDQQWKSGEGACLGPSNH